MSGYFKAFAAVKRRLGRLAHGLRPIYALTFLLAASVQLTLLRLDAFDFLYQYTRAHEGYHLDEWFLLLGVLAIAFFVCLLVRAQELKREAARRRSAEARLETAIENMSQGVCMFDRDQCLVTCNKIYAQMYELAPDQVRSGTTLRQILESRIANGLFIGTAPEVYISDQLRLVESTTPWTKVAELSDGRVIAINFRPTAAGGWVATHEDITAQRRLEARIAHLAHHDPLTDLVNRTLLYQNLQQALSLPTANEFAVVFCLDLDRFKPVNDLLGHAVGDALLQAVAARLRSCVRQTDTVGRVGGDEFVILVSAANPVQEATALAARILATVCAPYELQGHQVSVGTSIGIAIAPADGGDPDTLLRHADLALYQAKKMGRGCYRFFEEAMNVSMRSRHVLERDLKVALQKGELVLHYQPQVDLARNQIVGFEALLRWSHPDHGEISPRDFIPFAEETGLIIPIGEWIIRQACKDAVDWPGPAKVAVNLSPIQFRSPTLAECVINAVLQSGLGPKRLELEVTESVLLQEDDRALAIMHQLNGMGVGFALDDFGTGYSSLSYLRKFPFQKIKLDRSFVQNLMTTDDSSAVIVETIANLGTALGMRTTAEGVETREQVERARVAGCTEAQGYYYGRPMRAEKVQSRYFLRPLASSSAA
jgi:diguanylate cyclase (GGDEF)-like protein